MAVHSQWADSARAIWIKLRSKLKVIQFINQQPPPVSLAGTRPRARELKCVCTKPCWLSKLLLCADVALVRTPIPIALDYSGCGDAGNELSVKEHQKLKAGKWKAGGYETGITIKDNLCVTFRTPGKSGFICLLMSLYREQSNICLITFNFLAIMSTILQFSGVISYQDIIQFWCLFICISCSIAAHVKKKKSLCFLHLLFGISQWK